MRRGARLGVGERRSLVVALGLLAWIIGLLWIFPVAWTVFTSFKTEQDAAEQTLHHGLSLDRYSEVSDSVTGTLSLQTAFTNSVVVVVVSVVVITLFIPCIANFFMMVKERGWKTGLAIAAFIFPFAIGVGAVLNWALRALHVTL